MRDLVPQMAQAEVDNDSVEVKLLYWLMQALISSQVKAAGGQEEGEEEVVEEAGGVCVLLSPGIGEGERGTLASSEKVFPLDSGMKRGFGGLNVVEGRVRERAFP